MANKYLKIVLIVLLLFPICLEANGPPPPPDPEAPIDGGILGLFALAIGYAIKKIHDNSKR